MSFFQAIIRVPQAVLIKSGFLSGLFLILIFLGFKVENATSHWSIPTTELNKDLLKLNKLEGKWYYDGKPYNGYAIVRHSNGKLAERTGFYEGKRQGPSYTWFDNGSLASQKNYVENRLEGTAETWWSNGQQSAASNYKNRQRHGEQLKWYPDGQMARRQHFVHGKEEGLQQAWLRTGKLYANYEAKNGRFFGLKRSNLCYQLKNEVVQK